MISFHLVQFNSTNLQCTFFIIIFVFKSLNLLLHLVIMIKQLLQIMGHSLQLILHFAGPFHLCVYLCSVICYATSHIRIFLSVGFELLHQLIPFLPTRLQLAFEAVDGLKELSGLRLVCL